MNRSLWYRVVGALVLIGTGGTAILAYDCNQTYRAPTVTCQTAGMSCLDAPAGGRPGCPDQAWATNPYANDCIGPGQATDDCVDGDIFICARLWRCDVQEVTLTDRCAKN